MKYQQILAAVDHTCLSQTASWIDIKKLCDEGVKYHTASVCIPPCYVQRAREYAGNTLAIGTVVGFPNGYQTAQGKAFETTEAVRHGADEIDMVINLAALKNKDFDYVKKDIAAVRNACPGAVMKVIIETCLLTEDEKVKMCRIVSDSGADYIKTSTGFAGGGAVLEDIKLFKQNISPDLKIKAAGGIRTFEDAEAFLQHGASRIGTSSLIKIAENNFNNQKMRCGDDK